MIEQRKINGDLRKERTTCTFDVEELTNYLDGGAEVTRKRRKFVNFFLNDSSFKNDVPGEYLSHQELYEETIRKVCILFDKIKKWSILNNDTDDIYLYIWQYGIDTAIMKQNIPLDVHVTMFLPTLIGQGTPEQQSEWVPRALSNEILGTYAQTELGHGTFIRGLETTSTYDSATEEFILNSPTLTSYKWWPGGLGHSCNYAVVLAQLYTQGIHRGLHSFIVQIRDSETWIPLPGIKIGEIGSKFGMNSANNGYLAFDNVRIPRKQMLMKNSLVHKNGAYEKSSHEKLMYGAMVFVRVLIVRSLVTHNLFKSVTIAVRYSAIRRQSKLKSGNSESQILDYQTQQYKLFPVIATALVYKFAAQWLWEKYSTVTSELAAGDLKHLPELHAMACCLKAVGTADAAIGVTTCRLACGGHGFMNSSNLPNIYTQTTAAETYEGENTVLLLQTARFLMKTYRTVKTGSFSTSTTLSYMENYNDLKKRRWTSTLECMASAFYQVAGSKIEDCNLTIKRLVNSGVTQEDAWNQTSIKLTHASEAHCRAFVIDVYLKILQTSTFSTEIMKVLTDLGELICACWIINRLGDFLQFSNLKPCDVQSIQYLLEDCLKRIRPNAVGLVDSFDIHDNILDSTLGCYDGNVYERIFEEANKSPLNKEPVNRSFELYLKPFLKSNI
ncbi:Acyl-coenzyme A oxidase, N-terminal,Acyl-CoA oxidase/dehydrogenase, central domain,Acyl-CoA [Cinara cedri]|uniref:Acyl-coenzyme A oxidase n=1 Tax=Cinara cedri TaxID=506608 RepID=A0A5E4MKH6_9HEMI|nr:Acyl-coenzyme A oxidase, N-terminal,Acyl-CoA oxidase/dehydrogenase, central domain,Acyl-CoA [Cinara cedri]